VPIPYKPVETGCDPGADDALRLWEAARPPTTLAATCPFPLRMPAAPAAAAAAAGLHLDPADLVHRALDLAARGDFLIVEGAGGLLVPYATAFTNADLASRLNLPVLLVARTALGTINHVALTVAEMARRGLALAGVVLVRTTQASAQHEPSNADLIEATAGTRPLGTLRFLPPDELADPDRIASALEGVLPSSVLATLLAEVP
jgi:dethiobiotin synthetase